MDEPHKMSINWDRFLYASIKACSSDETDGIDSAKYGYSSIINIQRWSKLYSNKWVNAAVIVGKFGNVDCNLPVSIIPVARYTACESTSKLLLAPDSRPTIYAPSWDAKKWCNKYVLPTRRRPYTIANSKRFELYCASREANSCSRPTNTISHLLVNLNYAMQQISYLYLL